MALVESSFDAETGIGELLLNRPGVLNAVDVPLAEALHAAVADLAAKPGLRCLVFRGAGRAFMAGGDVAGFAADPERAGEMVSDLLAALHPVIERFRAIEAPVLASVHGSVAGAGMSLLAACDVAIAAEDTRFLLAYDRIGAAPDCGGTYFLPRLIGLRRLADLMFLSESWDAGTAQQAGLINRTVPAADLVTETGRLASRLASGPTRAYGAYKRLINATFAAPLEQQLGAERTAFIDATHTGDFRRAARAFVDDDKAGPEFRGD